MGAEVNRKDTDMMVVRMMVVCKLNVEIPQ